MRNRDDFTQRTIETLADRAGNRCSNPLCRRPTSGPRIDPAKAVSIGVAAHITAASEGGPRYDPALTSEQRKDIANGIWLCQNCAKLIDNDPERYPTDLLHQWKRQAEEAASRELEIRMPAMAARPATAPPVPSPRARPKLTGNRWLNLALVVLPPSLGLVAAAAVGWLTFQVSLKNILYLFGAYTGWIALLAGLAEVAGFLQGDGPPGPRPDVPYQASRPLSEFVGRNDELRRLTRALKPGARTAVTGLVGMGGIGKSELAKLAAHRVAGRFHDGVLWADCGQQDLGTIAGLWAAAYGVQLPGDGPAGDAGASMDAQAAAWRGLVSGKETLLIFDNVQPGQEIESLFPPRGRSAVLVTTRYGDHPALRGAACLALDQFTPAEAAALAEQILGRDAARAQAEDAARLFQLLGNLPLAVSVALHLAEQCGWDLATLVGRLEAAGALAVLGDKESLRLSLNAAFETAWANLPDDLRETYRTLALFNEGPSFSTFALAETLDLEEPEALARLRRLAGRSLLLDAGEGRWSLHPLLRQFAATRPPVDEAARARMARHYLGAAAVADDLYLEGGEDLLFGLALFDQEWPHIRAGQAWAAAHAGKDDKAARLCADYPNAGARCLDLRLHPREWIHWLDAGASAARRLGDRSAEASHMGNLGHAYRALGDAEEAIRHYEGALAIYHELGDRGGEGSCLGSLGNAYSDLGDARRAIEYYERALTIDRETGDRLGEGLDLGNLGNAYADLGDAHRAIECYEAALAIAREIGDRRGEEYCLVNLGIAYADQGDTRKAIKHYEDALAIAREIGDRGGEGSCLGSLGNVYFDLGKTRKAIEYYERALAIARETGHRRSEGNNLGNLGNVYADLGKTRKAIEHYEAALAIARETGDRRGEGADLCNLGNAHASLGDTGRARDFWTQALALYEDIEDPQAERVRGWLAELEA